MKPVVIYTSTTCPHCVTAKQYFDSIGVSYQEKNVGTDMEARKELMSKGYMGVPVIVVGEAEIVGFDKERIDQALAE